ncbi:hypothetical protein INR49_026258 [Caranx melampygus]|nr:hypothetical protein INR49_026258 [Caranx melampygus]
MSTAWTPAGVEPKILCGGTLMMRAESAESLLLACSFGSRVISNFLPGVFANEESRGHTSVVVNHLPPLPPPAPYEQQRSGGSGRFSPTMSRQLLGGSDNCKCQGRD